MNTTPRAPADSPCETDRSLLRQAMELLGAIGVGKAGAHALHNACNLRNRIDAHLQYHQLDNLRGDSAPPALGRPLDLGPVAPPVLSARPNEVTQEMICAACEAYYAVLELAGAKDSYAPDRAMRAALEAAERVKTNEADAPRGQAVAEVYDAQGDGYCFVLAFIAEFEAHRITNARSSNFDATGWLYKGAVLLRDKHKTAYCAPPPYPVGEAYGVREKYRAVTQDDADALAEHLSNIAIDEWPSRAEIFAGLLHIGAVVPNEVHGTEEGK